DLNRRGRRGTQRGCQAAPVSRYLSFQSFALKECCSLMMAVLSCVPLRPPRLNPDLNRRGRRGTQRGCQAAPVSRYLSFQSFALKECCSLMMAVLSCVPLRPPRLNLDLNRRGRRGTQRDGQAAPVSRYLSFQSFATISKIAGRKRNALAR